MKKKKYLDPPPANQSFTPHLIFKFSLRLLQYIAFQSSYALQWCRLFYVFLNLTFSADIFVCVAYRRVVNSVKNLFKMFTFTLKGTTCQLDSLTFPP